MLWPGQRRLLARINWLALLRRWRNEEWRRRQPRGLIGGWQGRRCGVPRQQDVVVRDLVLVRPVLQDSDGSDGYDSGGGHNPTNNGRIKPVSAPGVAGSSQRGDFHLGHLGQLGQLGHSQRDDRATRAATGQMFGHAIALRLQQGLLDETRQEARVRMSFQRRIFRQTLQHEFRNVGHSLISKVSFHFQFLPTLEFVGGKGKESPSAENVPWRDSCAKLPRMFSCKSRTSTSRACSASLRPIPWRIRPARIFLRSVLASLSTLRLMVDS